MLLRQPQHGPLRIDWANPITKGLALSMLPSNGFVDVVTGEQYIPFGTAPVISNGAFGKCLDSTAAFGGLYITPARNLCVAEQTHIIFVDYVSVSGSYAGLIASAQADGGYASFSFQNTSAGTYFAIYPTATTLARTSPFGPSVIVISGDASGSSAYKDGEIILASGPAPAVKSNSRLVLFGERIASPGYASKGRIYFHASFTRRLSVAEIISITRNPWQIYADHSDVEVLKSSAGGGATVITCNTGTATTAGIVAGISSATTLACNVGGATTAGVACALPLKVACNVGNATTAGIACSLPVVVQCSVGTATTAGVTAGISLDTSITIACNAGNATTTGVSATFPQTLSCSVGNATTAGITAQVDIAGHIVIGCNAGTATTTGIQANISSAFALACNAGNAATLGATAYFPQGLQCSPGNAIALGIGATFTIAGPTTIVCNVGNATASGISFSFGGTLVDAPNGSGPAIIIPRGTRGAVQNTTRPPNVGGIRI